MAIIQLEAGLFSLRLGHGAALTCHRHVIHSRAAASLPLKLPRCAVVFTQQHRFFDSLENPELSSGFLCPDDLVQHFDEEDDEDCYHDGLYGPAAALLEEA